MTVHHRLWPPELTQHCQCAACYALHAMLLDGRVVVDEQVTEGS